MSDESHPIPTEPAPPPPGQRSLPRRRLPSFGQVAACVSILALVVLVFTAGAAAMFFGLPPSVFLSEAFAGAQKWWVDQKARGSQPIDERTDTATNVDKPGKTFDGFTLVTTTEGPEARLIDMHGEVVHRWKMPYRRAWTKASDVPDPKPNEPIHWERCYLYPNGDLLALCSAGVSTPYGYALAKFDKDSELLWAYSATVHHDIEVDDKGRIYVVTQKMQHDPIKGMDWLPGNYIADTLVVLSAEGKELQRVGILEAFRDSSYVATLMCGEALDVGGPMGPPPQSGLPGPPQRGGPPTMPPGPPMPPRMPGPGRLSTIMAGDVLHTNSIKVLSRALAPKFPMFKEGQILLSMRSPSAIAVLDLSKRAIVWAAKGPWQCQHDARFLANGRIMLFDNLGYSQSTRIVEYDPATQAIPWFYVGTKADRFVTPFRGGNQRLPNGNTLFTYPERRLVEVTADKEIVWQWGFKPTLGGESRPNFTGATRYRAEELTFLKGSSNVRPR